MPCFKQLFHARQAARDVPGYFRLPRDLRQDVSRAHLAPILHLEARVPRNQVLAYRFARFIPDLDARFALPSRIVLHDPLRQAGQFVDFLS